jgi:hypothetical protein
VVGDEGFWLCARRTVPRIPAVGCKERTNEAHGQKRRRKPLPIFQTDSHIVILFRRRHPRRAALLIGNLANNVLSIIPAAIKQKMSFF